MLTFTQWINEARRRPPADHGPDFAIDAWPIATDYFMDSPDTRLDWLKSWFHRRFEECRAEAERRTIPFYRQIGAEDAEERVRRMLDTLRDYVLGWASPAVDDAVSGGGPNLDRLLNRVEQVRQESLNYATAVRPLYHDLGLLAQALGHLKGAGIKEPPEGGNQLVVDPFDQGM